MRSMEASKTYSNSDPANDELAKARRGLTKPGLSEQ